MGGGAIQSQIQTNRVPNPTFKPLSPIRPGPKVQVAPLPTTYTVSPAGDSNAFADYPTLGIDANALYIGVNIFSSRGQGSFSSTTGFVVRKSSLLGGGPIVATAFRKLVAKSQGVLQGLYTPQGVDNYDPAATEGYFIGVDPSFSGRLNLRRISNPGGTPTSSATIQITVPATGGTITVPHLGNSGGAGGKHDVLDIRVI